MIYMDNAATTPVKPEVLQAMMPYLTDYYGNPSSVYRLGAKSKEAVEKARHEVAALLGAKDNEIYFTAGGSESDNWAFKAVADAHGNKGHIITTAIEHHAVLHTARYLEQQGLEVTYLDVDAHGLVDVEELQRAIRPDTILISVMFANNEIGTIQPIREIGAIAHERGILFHTDAVQAYGHVPIDVNACHIDMLSASGHKLGGPKGVGMMYLRNDVKLGPFIHGGAQERNRRAGTLNVAGIVGFGKAAQLAAESMQARAEYETSIRDYMIGRIEREIPHVLLNGDRKKRLPNNVNFCYRFVQGESILIMLDMKDIYVSSGSACSSGSIDPSHVLLAIGRSREDAYGAVRMTISEETTREQADAVIDEVKRVVERLRSMSPSYGAFSRGTR
jgi:cysteine desulfurase